MYKHVGTKPGNLSEATSLLEVAAAPKSKSYM